ncbi:unnamed protein product [Calypogeia fissa]
MVFVFSSVEFERRIPKRAFKIPLLCLSGGLLTAADRHSNSYSLFSGPLIRKQQRNYRRGEPHTFCRYDQTLTHGCYEVRSEYVRRRGARDRPRGASNEGRQATLMVSQMINVRVVHLLIKFCNQHANCGRHTSAV